MAAAGKSIAAAAKSGYCWCCCWEYVLLLLRVGETLGRRCCWPHLSVLVLTAHHRACFDLVLPIFDLVLAANHRACLLLRIKPTWAVHVDEPYFCPDGGCWSWRGLLGIKPLGAHGVISAQSLHQDNMVNCKENSEHKTSFSRRNDSKPSLKQVNDSRKHLFMWYTGIGPPPSFLLNYPPA